MKIALVTADFNSEVTTPMEQAARERAAHHEILISHAIHVPGVYDMPVVVKRLLARKDVDAVVLIGAVIKGETKHDELICNAVAGAATALSLQFDKPVALGITGPDMTDEQAEARIGNAARAVDAAVRLVDTLKEIS